MVAECCVCKKTFSKLSNLNRHFKTAHDTGFSGFCCGNCNKIFTTKSAMQKHSSKCNISIQIGNGASTRDSVKVNVNKISGHEDEEESAKPVETGVVSMNEIVKSRWSSIKTYFKCRQLVDIFNFRLFKQKESLKQSLTQIRLNKIECQIKLQCSLGFVLQHKISHELRYFYSSSKTLHFFEHQNMFLP